MQMNPPQASKSLAMEAKELLQRYQQGERDFRGTNLEGVDLSGVDLSGIDLNGADIRGTNFSHATLIGANFCRVQAGLPRRWVMGLKILSFLLLAGVEGLLTLANVSWVGRTFSIGPPSLFAEAWAALVVQITFLVVFLRRGVSVAVAIAVVVAGALAVAVPIAIAITCSVANACPVPPPSDVVNAIRFTSSGNVFGTLWLAFAGAFTGTFAAALGFASTFAFAGTVAFAGDAAGALALAGALVIASVPAIFIGHITGAVISAVAGDSLLVCAYIGWEALKGAPRYALIRSAAITFASWGGTSFRGADLTNASFDQARLQSGDFRKATLIRTSWWQTQQLDRARPGKSFLANPQIRALVQTGQGKGLDLSNQNLRGLNLADAQLEGANFRAADLSESNLRWANLSNTNLSHTQLEKTDFTGACLTGATIEDWGISGETNLQGVRCEYAYMRDVAPGDPDQNQRREPNNHAEIFANGDFEQFIQPMVASAKSQKTSINIIKPEVDAMNGVEGNSSSTVSLSEIHREVSHTIQKLPSETDTDFRQLKYLLSQLQEAIDAELTLDNTEKAEALAQVKKLAKAGQAPQTDKTQQLAKRATGMISGLVSGMTEGARLVTAWEKVGPAILTLFGLL